jgi:hypothetical protein
LTLEQPGPPHQRGLPENLRAAIEDTLSSLGETGAAATTDLRAGTLGRARELLDPLVALGRDSRAQIASRAQTARAELAKRGTQAREVSTSAAVRVIEAISETLGRNSESEVEGE